MTEAAWSGQEQDSCIYSHYCEIIPALTLRGGNRNDAALAKMMQDERRHPCSLGGAEYGRYDNSFLNRWVNENCCFAEEKISPFKASRCRADVPREAGRRKNSLWRKQESSWLLREERCWDG